VALFLIAAAVVIGASLDYIALRPLNALAIRYPAPLGYWHVILPASCALLLLSLCRWRPVVAAVAAVGLCFTALPAAAWYADSQVVRVSVGRFLTPDELRALEAIPIRVFEQLSSSRGQEVFVAPADEQPLRRELGRFGLLRADAR
jgi:hypothetical protein